MPSKSEIALIAAIELLRKSGVREFESEQTRLDIAAAANHLADLLYSSESFSVALPDNILVQTGTAIVFADSTDHSPATANNLGTRTAQIDLTGLADESARQSDKVDLGATRAEVYDVTAALENAATPTAGDVSEFWWAPSPSGTAGTANPGAVSGADAAYTGYSSNLDASIKQLQFIGDFVHTAQATGTVQIARVGSFRPKHRYGSLVVRNRSGSAYHSDAVEMSVLLSPLAATVTD